MSKFLLKLTKNYINCEVMNMKKKLSSHSLPDEDFLTAASTTDCTGIVPSAPQDDYELNSYLDIMNFSPKDIKSTKK